jgi:hypothetical protein
LLGFVEASIADIQACSRFFALFAFALLILVSLAVAILVRNPQVASILLRRVASRRSGRCELSLVNAVVKLLAQDASLFALLHPRIKLDFDPSVVYVS